MPISPEHTAKLAQLAQVKKELSTAYNNKQSDAVSAKYTEKKAILADLKASRENK